MGPRRILFLTLWQFEDPLIQAYTLPYVKIISDIGSYYPYLVTLNKSIERTRISKKNNAISIILPSGRSGRFLGWVKNFVTLYSIVRKKQIGVIHPWCTPAATLGVVLKFFNRKLKLNIDSFEPHAEAMVENGTWNKNGLKYKVLFRLEKREAQQADNLIFAAPGMQNYIQQTFNVHVDKYQVKPACVNLEAFSDKVLKDKSLIQQFDLNDRIVCVYAGKFGGIYLEDETFEFIKACQEHWGANKFRFLLLSNVSDEYVVQMAEKYKIGKGVIIKLFVPHSQIAKYMGLADFAICPVKPVPTKKYCSPIKDGEYWALGLPVVITKNISVDSDIIANSNAGAVIETLNEEGYLNAVKKIDSIISNISRVEVYAKIRPLAEKYRNFSIAEDVYKAIYDLG
jgi:glycosyltransferase involved in cell wall biosynthesis